MSRARRQTDVTEVIIHCSATDNGKHYTAADIDGWHRERGFTRDLDEFPNNRPDLSAIGYHYVIRPDGVLEEGRALLEKGAHCQGHNISSVGVCLVGTNQFTLAQWLQLDRLLKKLKAIWPQIKIMGHRDTCSDSNQDGHISACEWLNRCPGFSVADYLNKKYKIALMDHISPYE